MSSLPYKVYFYTLGCRVNQYETDAARELFLKEGFEEADEPSKADVLIVNTCTVTGEADRKSRQRLRSLAGINPSAVIVAMGCASEMADGIFDADIVLGTRDKNTVVTRVMDFLKQKNEELKHKSSHACSSVTNKDEYRDFGTVISPEGSRAFMKIEDGCNNFCAYCVIPYARGRVVSRSKQSIKEEALNLASRGFKEIIVSGIEVCSYGQDMGMGISAFLEVLESIAAIDGIRRIRIGSLEPSGLSEEFLEGIGRIDKLCPHFHLSLQSGSDTVLSRMNRKYDTNLYLGKVEALRSYFPTMKLTTDIIAGFPGETDREFEDTCEFVKTCGINKIHVFPYSIRKGTKASHMPQVDGRIKKQRCKILRDISDLSEHEFTKACVGRDHEVLVESKKGDHFTGYTREYVSADVYASDKAEIRIGDIIRVRGTDALKSDLICKYAIAP